MTPTDIIELPKKLQAHIDRYNHDTYWKPGNTHTPFYEGKRIQVCVQFQFAYRLYIGSIGALSTDENMEEIEVIWDEIDPPVPIEISHTDYLA